MPCIKIKIYTTVILTSVLCGCETWSLTLREVRRHRLFKNRVLRKIFGPKRDEVTGECRRLRNKELYDLLSSSSIIRLIRSRGMMGGACSTCGVEERCIQGFGVEIRGRETNGRPKHRREENIKMDIPEVGCGGMHWIALDQNRDR